MATMQQYSLRWNNYFRHLTYALDNHRTNDDFVDVSLCCDGRKIKAHKVVLSSCSSYFKEIFKENPHPHPVIIFKFIKFEDLNSIVEFMYQGEVNVQQEALQSFLQTAELLAVQGLTAEEKDKSKTPHIPIIDEQKLIKTIPSTIRAINETTTTQSSQTIEIPTATIVQQQHIQPQQQIHLQTQQIQHIQVQHQPPQQQHQHQVTPVHLQQATHHTQQQQQQQLTSNVANVPTASTAVLTTTTKKRKITFSDDDDNIYTTETVDYAVKDDANIVKTSEMTFLRGTVKMDIPEYIVSEVDDSQQLSDGGGTQQTSPDATAAGGQNHPYSSEYEILTESEIEEKYNNTEAENSEITIEMGRLLSSTTTAGTTQSSIDDGTVKVDNKNSAGGTDESLVCGVCNRKLQSLSALRRHTASRHTQIREKKHDCIMCNKSFKTKWSLSTHNSRFHRDLRVAKECIKMEFEFS